MEVFIEWILVLQLLFFPSEGQGPQITYFNATSSTTVSVIWEEPAKINTTHPIISWVVEVSYSITEQLVALEIVNNPEKSVEIGKLTPGTSYKVRVAGFYSSTGIGPYSIFALTKTFKPITITSDQDSLIKLRVGTAVILSCKVDGFPLPYIQWLLDDVTLLDGSDSIQIIDSDSKSLLAIPDTMGSRGGVYKCNASNIFNSTSLTFVVEYYPQPPTDISHRSTFITITLNWRFQLNGSSPRTGVKIEIRKGRFLISSVMLKPNVTSSVFKDLDPLTVYTIYVYVLSNVGSSHPAKRDAITVYPTVGGDGNRIPTTIGIIAFLATLVVIIGMLFIIALILKYIYSKKTDNTWKNEYDNEVSKDNNYKVEFNSSKCTIVDDTLQTFTAPIASMQESKVMNCQAKMNEVINVTEKKECEHGCDGKDITNSAKVFDKLSTHDYASDFEESSIHVHEKCSESGSGNKKLLVKLGDMVARNDARIEEEGITLCEVVLKPKDNVN